MSKIALGVPVNTTKTWFTYPLRVPAEDLWSVHALGAPGYGKSTNLGNLTEQCADAGEGVLLIDPHGDLAEEVVKRTRHFDRLIYVAPAALEERYWGLNPFEFDRTQRHLNEICVNNVVGLFQRIGAYDPGVMATINKVLRQATRLALAHKEPTLLDLYQIIRDEEFRRQLMRRPHVHPTAYDYWQDFNQLSPRDRRGETSSTMSRLLDLLDADQVNRTVGQYHATLRIKDWLNSGQLIVVNLGCSGERTLDDHTGRMIGNLILAQVIQDTKMRTLDERQRRWRIIVDEFHRLAPLPFADLITDGRKYNVFPIIAHQTWSQIKTRETEVLYSAAQMASVSIELRASRADRLIHAAHAGQDTADELRELERYTAKVELAVGPRGTVQRHTLRLLPWWGDESDGQLARALARQEEMTLPKGKVPNLWERIKRLPEDGTIKGDGQQRQSQAQRGKGTPPAPRSDSLQQGASRLVPDGDDPAGDGGADGAGPVPLPQQRPNRPPLVSGPTQPQGPNPLGRRRPKGGQRDVPPAPERP